MAAFASFFSPVCKLAFASAVAVALWSGEPAWARRPANVDTLQQGDTIAVREMPAQGQKIYQAIFVGGPFRYDKDGAVFGNRERLLPRERRGHYREYTVDTPGSRNRGARRIVCGGPPRMPQDCWYTADHYASFKRIVP